MKTGPIKGTSNSFKRLLNEHPCILSQTIEKVLGMLSTDLVAETIPKTLNEKDDMFLRNCVIARRGSQLEYNLLKENLHSNHIAIKQIAIKSLACSQNPDNLNSLLLLIFNEEFKPFVNDILQAAAVNNDIGKLLFLKMLYNDFDQIVTHVDLDTMLMVFESIRTEFELKVVSWILALTQNITSQGSSKLIPLASLSSI